MKSKRFEKNYIYSERLLSTTSEGSLTFSDKGGFLRGLTDSGRLLRRVPQNARKQVFSTRKSFRLQSNLLKAMLVEPVNLLCQID